MAYWLFKSEPSTWSWDDLLARGADCEGWGSVRNYQARNIMRLMQPYDQAFFYHSQSEKAVMGIVEICTLSHPDSRASDPRWDCVDIPARRRLSSHSKCVKQTRDWQMWRW